MGIDNAGKDRYLELKPISVERRRFDDWIPGMMFGEDGAITEASAGTRQTAVRKGCLKTLRGRHLCSKSARPGS